MLVFTVREMQPSARIHALELGVASPRRQHAPTGFNHHNDINQEQRTLGLIPPEMKIRAKNYWFK